MRLRATVAVLALTLVTAVGGQPSVPRKHQSIKVVAIRGRDALTVCASVRQEPSKVEGFAESRGAVWVTPPSLADGKCAVALLDQSRPIRLPCPAVPDEADLLYPPSLRPTELGLGMSGDDPPLKRELEEAFRKKGQFKPVESIAEADYVFVAESYWRPLSVAQDDLTLLYGIQSSDSKENFTDSILAFAVPASIYSAKATDVRQLLEARVWEGLASNRLIRIGKEGQLRPASAADLVAGFPRKGLPEGVHLCAAASHALCLPGGCPSQPQPLDDRQPASLAVRVDDADGRPITDLGAREFHLLLDGVEQRIERVAAPLAAPPDVVVMLDASRSMGRRLDEAQAAAADFVDRLPAEARVMGVGFHDRVIAYGGFSTDRSIARRAIFQVVKGEGTRLFDALRIVCDERLDATDRPRRVVLVTDGLDTRSRQTDARAAVRRLQAADVPVFVVQVTDDAATKPLLPQLQPGVPRFQVLALPPPDDLAAADQFLGALGGQTGGRRIRANDAASLRAAFEQVIEHMRFDYRLTSRPEIPAGSPKPPALTVTVDRPGAVVK